jgi:hypothetical protein
LENEDGGMSTCSCAATFLVNLYDMEIKLFCTGAVGAVKGDGLSFGLDVNGFVGPDTIASVRRDR